MKVMQLISSPLFIEDRAGSHGEGKRGATLSRSIVVKNLGDRPAEVDLWIVATDPKSEPLLRWCTFSERNPFRVEARQSREVTLTFDIPQQATPDLYPYEVLVDAQAQYPDKPPVRRPQQIRVLPSMQDTEWGTDPTFSVQPTTQASNPYQLVAGETLEVTVQVKNCSKRVDRFYLTCVELPQDWFSVRYPESSLDVPGLVKQTDGLELNPGGSGAIALTLHPPRYTPAGEYFPTLRLTSSNDETLRLLDVVYLHIQVSDRLDLHLHPALQRLPDEAGLFTLELTNQGNVRRHWAVQALDSDALFHYQVHPAEIVVEPGATTSLLLNATPKQWWRRPWWGKGRELQFAVYLDDCAELPNCQLASSSLTQGTILWQPRPWWMRLLVILAGLGAIGAIGLAIWLTFFKPAPSLPQPEIIAIRPTAEPAAGEPIQLDWTISRLSQIDRIIIIHRERGVEVSRKNYRFAGTIPAELRRPAQQPGFCEPTKQDDMLSLSCRAMPIAPATPGTHTFQLQVFSIHNRREPADGVTTDSLRIAPAPTPTIVQVSPTSTTYQISGSQPIAGAIAPPVRLNWDVSAPDQIQELQVVGMTENGAIASPLQRYSLTNGLPAALQEFCTLAEQLICRNVPTTADQAGTYAFQLTLISLQSGVAITKQTPPIRIQPFLPQLHSFQVNGQEVGQQPVYQVELSAQQSTELTLSWQVEAGQGSRVELLPAPGSVPTVGSIDYPLSLQPGQQTITLQITSASGEQITRSLLVETIAPPPPVLPLPTIPQLPPIPTAPKPPESSPSPPKPETPSETTPGLKRNEENHPSGDGNPTP